MYFLLISAAFAVDSNLRQALHSSDINNSTHSISVRRVSKFDWQKKSLKSQMAPTLNANVNWMYFGDPLEVNLMGDEPVDCASFEAFGFGDLCASFNEPMRLRDERVLESTFQGILPVTALYSISQGITALEAQEKHARLDLEINKSAIRVEVVNAYLDVLTLQNAAVLSKQMSARLRAKKNDVSAFVQEGLAAKLDLERLINALEQAQLGEKMSLAGEALAQQKLNLLVGETIQVTPLSDSDWKALDLNTTSQSVAHPLYQQGLANMNAAAAASKVAWSQLIPHLSLIAGYTQQSGQGQLTPDSQQYVGFNLKGQFNWGHQFYKAKSADIDVVMARDSLVPLKNNLELQQAAARLNAENSFLDFQMKKQLLQTALLAHEQIQLEFDQQLKSATDLLDSESQRLKAEMDFLKSKRNVLSAIAEYQAAAGLVVDPQSAFGE